MPISCPNCDAKLTGRFCANCGQDCGNLRFDTRFMLAEGVRQIAGWDGALVRTMTGLWSNPGGLARDYVEGRRRSYLNPARFCLVSLALWLLVVRLLGLDLFDGIGVEFSTNEAGGSVETDELRAFVERHFDWLLLLTFPVRAWWIKVAFRRSRASVAECLVQVLYVAGFGFLVGILLSVADRAGASHGLKLRPLIGVFWSIRAARVYFSASWTAATLKMLWVTFAHMAVTVLIMGAIAVPWVLWR